MKFSKRNLSEILIEDAHGGAGKRQMLLDSKLVASKNWEAVTKGFLSAGQTFENHSHESDELFIVISGEGFYVCDGEETDYKTNDIFTTPAGAEHSISAKTDSEFYFVRVKL